MASKNLSTHIITHTLNTYAVNYTLYAGRVLCLTPRQYLLKNNNKHSKVQALIKFSIETLKHVFLQRFTVNIKILR